MNGVTLQAPPSTMVSKGANGMNGHHGGKNGVSTTSSIHNNNNDSSSKRHRRPALSLVRSLLIDLPLMLVFGIWIFALVVQFLYQNYVMHIVDSYRRGAMDDFYHHLHKDFTYYNRLCDADDVTTRDANDLIIHPNYSGQQAADVMLKHGSVLFQQVLSNETAASLRAYLDSRNKIQSDLPFNEKFYAEENRLALGLGIHDDASIGQALKEVGSHPVVKRTLESILGPDPSVLEVSTMTSMHGAPDQGIHSDSDWFGSAVLYSRTFLHSYSMFIALQDTTQQMGATTICPGSHNCANQDLEDVCLDNGAFEVSTNGYTGQHGVLQKGDALLFNQNIWHRGAANQDPTQDRVMFIVTFGSRTKSNPHDYRQLALGTYYYQRWNMWGHTFADLKDATKIMALPLGALRGLGLWKPRSRNWGVTWVEQFSRQLANREDFYDYYCLLDFVGVLQKWHVPKFLQGSFNNDYYKDKWEKFLEETMSNWTTVFCMMNIVALSVYFCLRILVALVLWKRRRNAGGSQEANKTWVPSWIKRIVVTHGSILLLTGLFLRFVHETELAQYAATGRVFDRPYDYKRLDKENANLGRTTLPTRNDVLIGTRFDSDFLGNYNRMLDIHPGNDRWLGMVNGASQLPESLHGIAAKFIEDVIATRRHGGMIGRFLLQDYTNGHWTLTTRQDGVRYTEKQLIMESNPLLKRLGKHLSSVLAESRFGAQRSTAMARRFTPQFVNQWERHVVFESLYQEKRVPKQYCRVGDGATGDEWQKVKSDVTKPSLLSRPESRLSSGIPPTSVDFFEVGDAVLANYRGYGRWLDAKIEDVEDENGLYFVRYEFGGTERVAPENLFEHLSFEEGDYVEVEAGDYTDNWFPAVVGKMHPDGSFTVRFEDDGSEEVLNGREHVRFAGMPGAFVTVPATYELNEKMEGNYLNRGEWFPATVIGVNDDGTYNLLYDDGDLEDNVTPHFLRKLQD